MLKINKEALEHIEREYPGVVESIRAREGTSLPPCNHCGSEDTASVACGIVGRTTVIAAATTKAKLCRRRTAASSRAHQ
jgi:hypothetical protein